MDINHQDKVNFFESEILERKCRICSLLNEVNVTSWTLNEFFSLLAVFTSSQSMDSCGCKRSKFIQLLYLSIR